MKILRTTDRNFRYDFGKVYHRNVEVPESVQKSVAAILDDLKRIGDEALFKHTEKFDHYSVNIKTVEVPSKEMSLAARKLDAKDLQALKTAAKRIEEFAGHHLEKSWEYAKDDVSLGLHFSPLERIGIYVPGGKAAYPSTVLMTAIPARVAGVKEIIMCSPRPGGEVNDAVLAAAKIAGVGRIFKVGGAQAIGAMAYGTKTIPRVDKIVGPGNIYVTWAKKMVFGQVDIDMIAGPTEICILADGSVPAEFMAADLLAQAEHDEMACPLLITDNSNYASRVEGEVRRQLIRIERKAIASESIQKRALIVLVRNLQEGVDLVNEVAPEHLELALKEARSYVPKIRHAGAIFVGENTPETIGDYIAGPSHVLPTIGTARYYSVLTASDFIKATSVISFGRKALGKLGPPAARLARLEGLSAHAHAVEVRLKKANHRA
ncbi:MAG: histidinol dehydrogenase [Deltaproteobacteria bacterium]|nr:histidinol dehydrogenase [Deltaproteobacteria bacterium]